MEMTDRRHGKRSLRSIGIGCLLFLTGTVFVAWALQRSLVFPRFHIPSFPDGTFDDCGAERLFIDIPDGRVEAWWLPGHGTSVDSPGPAVIFAHGNAELIDMWAQEMERYRRRGIGVLLPEFRGYGRSDGTPSEQGITEDFVRFYDIIAARDEVDQSRIFFHGRSLGGGAVCALALKRRPCAMVLNSTFTSVRDMAWRYGFPGFLVRDPFDNTAFLKDYDGPVLIQHGTKDSLIPFNHAEDLHSVAGDSTLITYDADHNDMPYGSPDFWEAIGEFVVGACGGDENR